LLRRAWAGQTNSAEAAAAAAASHPRQQQQHAPGTGAGVSRSGDGGDGSLGGQGKARGAPQTNRKDPGRQAGRPRQNMCIANSGSSQAGLPFFPFKYLRGLARFPLLRGVRFPNSGGIPPNRHGAAEQQHMPVGGGGVIPNHLQRSEGALVAAGAHPRLQGLHLGRRPLAKLVEAAVAERPVHVGAVVRRAFRFSASHVSFLGVGRSVGSGVGGWPFFHIFETVLNAFSHACAEGAEKHRKENK